MSKLGELAESAIRKLRDVLLVHPFLFDLYQALIGSQKAVFANEYIKIKPGDKVLEIGCGPGQLVNYLAGAEYLGFDISKEYIDSAKKKFAGKGEFICCPIEEFSPVPEKYDVVIANGVLHHVPDDIAFKFFDVGYKALKKGGRMLSLDGCYREGQSAIARFMLRNDRGKFVRHEHEYLRLAKSRFSHIKTYLRDDVLRVPCTLILMEGIK